MDEEILEPEEEIIEEEGLREKLKKLREELKICQKEKDEYLAGWQRAKADFINARKDEERARENFLKFAEEDLLKEFLALADSLELALKLKPARPAGGPSEGLNEIYSQLRGLFKERGLNAIEAKGSKFDPMEHESLEKVEVQEEKQDNIVLEELQKGYKLHDKILRPARVKIGYYVKNIGN